MSDLPTPLVFATPPSAEHKTFNVLLYGKPKSGKSTGAATAPGPILWINAEGANALDYARKVAAQRGTTIHEVRIDPAAKTCAATLDNVYRHVTSGADPQVQTVVVDTVAKVREALIEQYVVQGSKNSLQQFGQVAKKLDGFIKTMRDLPINLVLLAHVDVKESEGEGRIVDPLIGGKLTETVPGEVDVVAFTATIPPTDDQPRRYVGLLVDNKGRTAGDRSGGLAGDQGFRDLDLAEWLDTYRAALAVDDSDLPFTDGDQPPSYPDEPVVVTVDDLVAQGKLETEAA